MSISTGIVADSSVNCDDAVQVGLTAIAKMMGKTYAKLTLRRKDKVKSFGAMKNTVRVRGEDVVVNPSLLFNRITCILNTSSELDVFLQYELAPQPPALFVDGQMRKSLYALKFIHTYESVDISHVDAQLTVQKLEQFQKSRSHDQPAQLVTITLLTPGSGLPAHQCHFTFPLTNLKC